MPDFEIDYPSESHKNYIESVCKFCEKNELTMILKGSLAKGTATEFSDIDLVISGNIGDSAIDGMIALPGDPVMTNLTENPEGILILVYRNGISVDLDLRETISQKDLREGIVMTGPADNVAEADGEPVRKKVNSKYVPERPEWYKTLRLMHKGTVKYLSGKKESAYGFLDETKEKLPSLKVSGLKFGVGFEEDMKRVFDEFCKEFEIGPDIKAVFYDLFEKF